MSSRGKKRFALCVVLLLLATLCPSVFCAVPEPTADFFVNDYADALSDSTEQAIQNEAVALYNETTAQVCVLTIDSLDGEDISEYSVEVFRNWGIGDAEADNGVLILVSIGDREMWVTTGYGVEGTLTDTRLGQLRDTYAIPYYSEDNFDEGTLQLFNAITNELRVEEYGLNGVDGFISTESTAYGNESNLFDGIAFIFIYISIMLVVVAPPVVLFAVEVKNAILLSYDKKHGTNRAEQYAVKAAKIKKYMFALWILSNRNRRNSGSKHHSGGNFRGGGFGGGGGGFRGGGGSTGGGGAGGRF